MQNSTNFLASCLAHALNSAKTGEPIGTCAVSKRCCWSLIGPQVLFSADRATCLKPESDEHGSAMAIGSGGNYALAAARALLPMELDLEEIVRRSMRIAAEICVYTNTHLVLESL